MLDSLRRDPLRLPMVAQTLDHTCGPACFESMFKYFKGWSHGEMYFAVELGSLSLGFTPPENIVSLARSYGFLSEMIEGASLTELLASTRDGQVTFVTWWDEDAGHYSLVRQIDEDHIILMDPWTAREGRDNRLPLAEFIPNWQVRGARLILVSLAAVISEGDSKASRGSW